jgi:hypothetical protein
MSFDRIVQIELPKKQSAFLWGARKTGKSTYLKAHFPQVIYYDWLCFLAQKTTNRRHFIVIMLSFAPLKITPLVKKNA